jgi:proteasome lid subunit RPN8/RPN11
MRRPKGLSKFVVTDREQCGILVEEITGDIKIVEVPNSADRGSDYAILMSDFKRVIDDLAMGESVVGFFHTHLQNHDKEPTDADFEGADLFPQYNNCIYKPDTKEIIWYGGSPP